MFGIGEGELAIIVVFGFLLFGPDKLPQMGRTIGRAIRQFRETQEKMTAVVQSEIIDPVSEAASAPVKPKKAAATDDDSDADEDAAETAAPELPAVPETTAGEISEPQPEPALEGEIDAARAAELILPAETPNSAEGPVAPPPSSMLVVPLAETQPEMMPMVSVEPTKAELARMKDAVKPVVDKYAAQLDPELIKAFNAELERVKNLK